MCILFFCSKLTTLHRYHLDPEKMSNPSFVDEEVFGESVERVINFSRMDEAYALHEAASLHDAVRFFASHAARGVHRVAIVAGDEKQAYLQSVLTQSDLVAFAAEHRHLLPQAKQTLAELGMVRSIVAGLYFFSSSSFFGTISPPGTFCSDA